MATKFIFTADDFGPIDFINKGVHYAVHKGLINSVQILANGDKAHLVSALKQLNEVVPKGNALDVGLHLTLTSGKPVFKKPGKSAAQTWDKMLKKGAFKNFGKFYFGYDAYFDVIENEFDAQLKQLQDAMTKAAANRLKLTSLTHHHGIFAIDDVFFKKYADFGKKHDLAIRNPKALPASANNSFFGFVVPLFNLTDRKEDRKEMERMNDAFGKYGFWGRTPLTLKTPHYTEVGFYGNYGSLANVRVLHEKRIEKRVKKFDEILHRAAAPPPIHGEKPKDAVVELVCHLGNPMVKQRGFKQAVKGYSGVNHKYFEDRQHEVLALERIHAAKPELKEQWTSWEACRVIDFKPHKS